MSVLGPKAMSYIKKGFLWSHYTYSLPIEWNFKENCQEVTKNVFRIRKWKISSLFHITHHVICLLNVFWILTRTEWEDTVLPLKYRTHFLNLALTSMFTIGFCIQSALVYDDIPLLYEQYCALDEDFEERGGNGPKSNGFGKFLQMCYYGIMLNLGLVPIFILHPFAPPHWFLLHFPVDSLPKLITFSISSVAIAWSFAVNVSLMMFLILSTALPALMICKSGVGHIMIRERGYKRPHRGLEKLVKGAVERLNLNRSVQTCLAGVNHVCSAVTPVAQLAWMFAVIVSSYCFVRIDDPLIRVACIITAGMSFAIGAAYNRVSASVYEESKRCLDQWRYRSNTKLMRRRIRSLTPMKVNCGSLFYFDRGILPNVVKIIQENTLTSLLIE